MFDVVRFWLDAGVDGFRLDAVHHIAKHTELPDNPVRPLGGETTAYRLLGEFDSVLHRYDKNDPFVHEVLRRFRHLLDTHLANSSGPHQVITEPTDRLSTGEVHLFDWPDWPRHWSAYYGEQQDELHMPLNLVLVDAPWSATAFRKAIDTVEATLPAAAWPNLALGNHDESRVRSRYGELQARAAMLMLLTLRGTPIIYYGDELGLPDTPLRDDQVRDPWGRNQPGLGRDPQRGPMPWSAAENADFCAAGVRPWLPLHPQARSLNVDSQSTRPDSMLRLTRDLLRLRKTRPELAYGSIEWLDGIPVTVLGYLRSSGEHRSYCLVNFAAESATVRLPERGTAVAGTLPGAGQGTAATASLRPYEALVIAA